MSKPWKFQNRIKALSFYIASISFFFLLTGSGVEASRHKKRSMVDLAEDSVAIALVPVPEDLEVCFSPEERCDLKLVKFIDSAQKSLEVAIFDINLGLLVDHLIAQSKKIAVRMVVDRKQALSDHSAVRKLLGAGVSIRFGNQRGIMHNKFVIVDGRMMETGSFNQTNGASFMNNENQLYLANPKVLQKYQKRFEQLWQRAKPVRF